MKKRYVWNFEKMHISLKALFYCISGLATMGWIIGGMWLLHGVMSR